MVVEKFWIRQYHQCEPYEIKNMDKTGHEIRAALKGYILDFISHYVRTADNLLQETYEMAYKYLKTAQAGIKTPLQCFKTLANIRLLRDPKKDNLY